MELSIEERRRIERQLANNNGATYMAVNLAEAERLMVARAVADEQRKKLSEDLRKLNHNSSHRPR